MSEIDDSHGPANRTIDKLLKHISRDAAQVFCSWSSTRQVKIEIVALGM